jgi:Cu-Zn family superoxide dismutase
LGNVTRSTRKRTYHLSNVTVQELWGRSIIVHAGPDDEGKGPHEDSITTGHSGARMACAIFGRG